MQLSFRVYVKGDFKIVCRPISVQECAGSRTTIQIQDESGQVVRTISGETEPSLHRLDWDGTDDGGNQLPDGVYRAVVGAVDGNDAPVSVAQGTVGRVTGVEIADGQVVLSLNGLKIPIDKVVSITQDATETPS